MVMKNEFNREELINNKELFFDLKCNYFRNSRNLIKFKDNNLHVVFDNTDNKFFYNYIDHKGRLVEGKNGIYERQEDNKFIRENNIKNPLWISEVDDLIIPTTINNKIYILQNKDSVYIGKVENRMKLEQRLLIHSLDIFGYNIYGKPQNYVESLKNKLSLPDNFKKLNDDTKIWLVETDDNIGRLRPLELHLIYRFNKKHTLLNSDKDILESNKYIDLKYKYEIMKLEDTPYYNKISSYLRWEKLILDI